jgi:hypothetical protein
LKSRICYGSSKRFPRTRVTSANTLNFDLLTGSSFWMHRFRFPPAAYRLYIPNPKSTGRHCTYSTRHLFSSSPSSSFHTSVARNMATLQELDAVIAEQSALFNQLKARADPAEAAELEASRVRLGELKKSRGALLRWWKQGQEEGASAAQNRQGMLASHRTLDY